ncbi:MAG: VWA domain-containing protein, partial [Deltaproteobacteria bacterium]|nr:VWA domain-containing protein [Deltaproteobacteria bacterium]
MAHGCGDEASQDETVAIVEPVVGVVSAGERSGEPAMRVSRGEIVQAGAGGLVRVALDGGARLLLGGIGTGARLAIRGSDEIELVAGRLYADVETRDALSITTRAGTLRLADAAVSIDVGTGAGGGDSAYVVRGEIAYATAAAERGTVSAGRRLRLGGARAQVEDAVLWTDWTGGLARPGPRIGRIAAGVGVLEARVPDELGLARWPLVIRRLDVRVSVHEDQAVTEVDQVFFNPASESVEGYYRFQAPRGAVLQRFAVDRGGRLVDGYVREQQQARAAYEAQVYRGSTDDPALLEWVAPGSYRARIYPIPAGAARRIVVRYVEWLASSAPGRPRQYRYPMGSGGANAPRVQELSLAVDFAQSGASHVRAGLGAAIDPGTRTVTLRKSDYRPSADFWLDLEGRSPSAPAQAASAGVRAYRAPYVSPRRAPGSRAVAGEADERDFYLLPLVLAPTAPTAPTPATSASRGIDLVIVADASAATDRSHLEVGRTVVESLVAHLGPDDRVAVVTSDLAIQPLGGANEPRLGPSEPERVNRLLDALARTAPGGATDLGEAIGQAAALLDPSRNGAVVYVGDGAPTVGELGSEELLTRIARLPAPPRLYAVAVGQDARLDLLETLAGHGGLALRVEERGGAADVALRILAHAHRPVARAVTVTLGTGIDAVYPRRALDVVTGEPLVVMGRVRGEVPRSVVVEGVLGGRRFRQVLAVETRVAHDRTDLRLRWAHERLRHLLGEGEGRETVAELGTRYGLITPYTSYYVPSERELREMGEQASLLFDR